MTSIREATAAFQNVLIAQRVVARFNRVSSRATPQSIKEWETKAQKLEKKVLKADSAKGYKGFGEDASNITMFERNALILTHEYATSLPPTPQLQDWLRRADKELRNIGYKRSIFPSELIAAYHRFKVLLEASKPLLDL